MKNTATQGFYDALVTKVGLDEALSYMETNNVAIGSYTNVTYEGINAAAYGPTQNVSGETSEPLKRYGTLDPKAADAADKYNPYGGLGEGENRVTGGYGLDTLPAWLGGKNNTGIVNAASGVVNAGATIGKTYLAYQQFQQNKIDNEKKFALMQEANMMKRTQMNNMVAEARRRSAAGMGNSNNQTATLASAARNPYLNAQYSRVG